MRTALIWLGAAVALSLLNLAIFSKEQVIRDGEVVYLKLAPVDPRSLMQGDYMVLNYEISQNLDRKRLDTFSGALILQLDDNRVAHFARYPDDTPLTTDERLIRYRNRRGAHFGIEHFFFQEGKGELYADAQYAKIKLAANGNAILVDLVKAPGQ